MANCGPESVPVVIQSPSDWDRPVVLTGDALIDLVTHAVQAGIDMQSRGTVGDHSACGAAYKILTGIG